MRVFQNSGVYTAYMRRLDMLAVGARSFSERLVLFLHDRYGACHILEPVMESSPDVFFTNGDDEILQRYWAVENGLPASSDMETILLSQIEHHRTEIFYNSDPMRYGNDFVRKLPGSVRKSIMWRAAPSGNVDFGAYDLIVCNFPAILESYRKLGWRAEYFAPAHDPAMDSYSENRDRPIDVLFVGGYSRHHRRRAEILEAVSAIRRDFEVSYHLDRSRLTKIAESPIGWLLPLGRHRRPKNIRAVSRNPLFGRQLYEAISKAKIVLNGAVDMAGTDRGNMRCWEALGCGALMVSDAGVYPEGMVDNVSIATYEDAGSAAQTIVELLRQPERLQTLACEGNRTVRALYSKHAQWLNFQRLAGKA
ncbi:glycosyltransferase family 1 protein [Rhizobium ruizarguesonis]|uniref:glycosyltransferase family protein n=1 Tax=Rhizobium ruizarguesonis TaxID=2081791 RepID=UPI0010306414|nr:glycosyltransferase [Rhizobium ruizarguesonis]TAV97372.1 glycosyltransferase family 1 protein [Rhizobium ruizarguesonis]